MSNQKDSLKYISKTIKSSIEKKIEESTTLKSSGYHSASDSENSMRNNSKENQNETKTVKRKMPMKGKVISSRYRQAALSTTARMRNSPNSLQRSLLPGAVTLRTSDINWNSPMKMGSRTGVSSSCMNVHKGGKLLEQFGKRTIKARSSLEKMTSDLQGPNLHSTAVNATLLDSTRGYTKPFSTTVVKAPSKRRTPAYMADISAIQPFTTVDNLTSPTICLQKKDTDDETSKVTQADLDLDYLRYLTWAYVDSSSEEAFQYQCSDAEKQISFLMHIIKEKQKKNIELKKYLMLSKLHQRVIECHGQLVEVLHKFSEAAPTCQEAVKEIGRSLQQKVNQVKLKNIHIPEDKNKFEEELKIALLEMNDVLNMLHIKIAPRQKDIQSINATVNSLRQKMDAISICKKTAERVAGCSIQEASLNLTVNDLQNNNCKYESNFSKSRNY